MTLTKRFTLNRDMNKDEENYLWNTGKCVETKKRSFVMCFDDEVDHLAFLVAIGGIEIIDE